MFIRCLTFVFAISIVSITAAQLPNPVLTEIFPRGAQIGTQQEVTIAGRDLDEPLELIFSHPGIQSTPKSIGATEFEPARTSPNQFIVEVAENVPPGIYEARSVGRFGVSTPLAFLVHRESHAVETGDNHSLEKTVDVAIPAVVHGRADTNKSDHYRLKATKGQVFTIHCITQDLDSRLESVVSILSPDGRPLKRSRSVKDTTLTMTFPSDGEYVVTVHDSIFAGGGEYAYALKITDQPVIDFVLPAAGLPGKITEFTFYGRNLAGSDGSSFQLGDHGLGQIKRRLYVPTRAELVAAHSDIAGFYSPLFRYPASDSSASGGEVSIGLASAPIVTEVEPNDRQQAQRVTLPVEISGTFYPRRDQDWVRFAAQKGQPLQIEVHASPNGIVIDPAVYVWQVTTAADGTETFSNRNITDDTKLDGGRYGRRVPRGLDYSQSNPIARYTIPEDGEYCISVRDLFGNARNDPRSVYRLVVKPAQPTFHLLAWTQRFRVDNNNKRVERASLSLHPSESRELLIDVIRDAGFNAPVLLRATGLPKGISCPDTIVAPGQTEAALVFTAAPDAPMTHSIVEITGSAEVNGTETTRRATFGRITSDVGNVAAERPSRRPATSIVVSTTSTIEKAPAVVEIDNSKIWKSSVGSILKVPVKYVRNSEIKGELKVNSIELPGEIKPTELVLKQDATEGTLNIPLNNAKVVPGKYSFYLTGQVAANFTRNSAAISQVEKQFADFSTQFDAIKAQEKEVLDKHGELQQRLVALNAKADSEASQKQTVESAIAELKTSIDELAPKAKRAEQFRKTLEERLANLKKLNGPRDAQIVVTSTPVTIEVVKSPLTITRNPAEMEIKLTDEESVASFELRVDRQYGFAEAVEVTANAPEGYPQIEIASIPKDQNKTVAKVTIPSDTSPGRYEYPVNLKIKFGDVEIQDGTKIILNIAEPEDSKPSSES